MIKRILLLIKRNLEAKKLGLPYFIGIGKLKLPNELIINKKKYDLNYPINDNATAFLVFVEVFLDDCYQLNLLPDEINSILDIGSNMGFTSLKLAAKFNPKILVCYEPNEKLIPLITKNLEKLSQCVIENKGIGKENGLANLNFVERDSEIVTGLTKTSHDASGNVVIESFHSVIKKYGPIDLVKMDCEGAEWEFMTDEAWKDVKYLTMEYHLSLTDPTKNFENLKAGLSLNFLIIKTIPIDNLTGMILAKNKNI